MAHKRASRALARSMPGDNSRQGSGTSHFESAHVVPPPRISLNMPAQQGRLQHWLRNFARAVSEDPARFKLTPGDAAKLMQHAQAFDDAMHRANTPSTATQPATKAKNEAMAAAKAVFREYGNRIKDDPLIDIADKLDLGMKQTKPTRSTAALRSPPILSVGIAPPKPGKAGVEGAHLLRYADSRSPNRRRKPEGVDFLEVRIIISPSPGTVPGVGKRAGVRALPGAGPIVDPDIPASDDVIVRNEKLTRNPSTIEHDPQYAGMTATYFGRWCTKSKTNPITGPWSRPVAMTVAVGGLS